MRIERALAQVDGTKKLRNMMMKADGEERREEGCLNRS